MLCCLICICTCSCGHMIRACDVFLPHTPTPATCICSVHLFLPMQTPEVKIETSSFCLPRFSFLLFFSISVSWVQSFSRVGFNPSSLLFTARVCFVFLRWHLWGVWVCIFHIIRRENCYFFIPRYKKRPHEKFGIITAQSF